MPPSTNISPLSSAYHQPPLQYPEVLRTAADVEQGLSLFVLPVDAPGLQWGH